jgi:uncharacterized protein (TIGR01777 family)
VIAGGTGFVGKRLCERLLQHGHQVSVLSRDAASARSSLPASVDVQTWDPAGPPPQLPEGTGAIVNLAGESIAGGRWTEQRKVRIRESRMQATDALVEAIRAASLRPSVLVNASAVGYYGPRGDEPLSEDAAPGRGFLTDTVLEWEHRARAAEALVARVVLLRIGVVLGRDAGALPQMSIPFKLFVGGPVASGKQWMSWIHIDDVVGMIVWAIENPQVSGPVNAVAPQALTNAEFSKEIGRALGRPSWLSAPAFALELLFGEMAEALLINGQRVVPTRAQELGYSFEYPTARAALEEALG